MNFQQIKARTQVLLSLENWTDVSPVPDVATLVNRAYEMFCWDSEIVVSSETLNSVINQSEYTLTTNFKAILDVSFSAVGLRRSEENYERYLSANWQATAGTPVRYVRTSINRIALIPRANAVASIVARGISIPSALINETDVPTIPSIYHEAIALKAAILHAQIYAKNDSMQRLNLFEQQYQRMIDQARTTNVRGWQRRKGQEP